MDFGSDNSRLARLALLKLEGFRPGEVLLFCHRCDFQCASSSAVVRACPVHETALDAIRVTEFMKLRDAKAA